MPDLEAFPDKHAALEAAISDRAPNESNRIESYAIRFVVNRICRIKVRFVVNRAIFVYIRFDSQFVARDTS